MSVFVFSGRRIVPIGSCEPDATHPRKISCRDQTGRLVACFTIGEFIFFPDGIKTSERGVFLPDRREASLLPGWRPSEDFRQAQAAALH